MAVQAYAFCPGGTGKKIQFCCKDLQGDLQKIDRMIEGEQYAACVQHIENLQHKPGNEDRACLMAIKGQLLRVLDRVDDALANAQAFVAKHPDNCVAHAELAINTAIKADDCAVAMPALQRALELIVERMEPRVYEAMSVMAEAAVEDDHWATARAIWSLQAVWAKDDPRPLSAMIELNRSPQLPLLLKDEYRHAMPPVDSPWRTAFEDAARPLIEARWSQAAERLTALAEQAPTLPEVWRMMATVRLWLMDEPGAIDALRRYAALDVPFDNAVEAEALAILLSKNVFDDLVPVYQMTWTVRDADRMQEALLSDPRLVSVRIMPPEHGEEPPPRGGFLLLDRPPLAAGEEVTCAGIATQLGQALLYGKQTDREARLVVAQVAAGRLAEVKQMIAALGGDALEPDAQEESLGETSASMEILRRRWHPPRGVTPQQLEALRGEFDREAVVERWPQVKLGVLGGRSAAEAASDPACRVRLAAAILVLETTYERQGVTVDFNELRQRLGVPVPQPVDLPQFSIDKVPLVRLHLVAAEPLSDEQLLTAFRHAALFNAVRAVRRFAAEIIRRESLAGQEERWHAYSALARTAPTTEEALGYIDAGRQAAVAAGQSCGSWDLVELSYRFGRGDGQRALELIRHLERRHMEEPGIAESLNQLLVEVGVLRPDGTFNAPAGEPTALGDVGAGLAPPGAAPPAEQGGLWTPDSQQSGGGKLWVPE